MIRLINNEFIKLRKIRIIFSQCIFLIVIYLMKRLSDENLFDLVFNLIPFIGIYTCILFSNIIVGEIDNGSFRYYLTKPFKRYKIYLSKAICIFIYITFSILLVVLFTELLMTEFNINFITKYFIYSIPIYFIGIYNLYLSTILRNHSLVLGLSIFTLSFSLIISQFFFGLEFNIIEYTFYHI